MKQNKSVLICFISLIIICKYSRWHTAWIIFCQFVWIWSRISSSVSPRHRQGRRYRDRLRGRGWRPAQLLCLESRAELLTNHHDDHCDADASHGVDVSHDLLLHLREATLDIDSIGQGGYLSAQIFSLRRGTARLRDSQMRESNVAVLFEVVARLETRVVGTPVPGWDHSTTMQLITNNK